MKCPCCEQEVVGRKFLAHDGKLYTAKGVLKEDRHALRTLNELVKRPQPIPSGSRRNITAVAVSKLRRLFRDAQLPFVIQTDRVNHLYHLRDTSLEQNNDAAEHPKDVHS